MNKNVVFAVVLGLLIVISVVQALQLSGLREKIANGGFSVSGKATSTSAVASDSSSGAASDSKSLSSLPSMVGGC